MSDPVWYRSLYWRIAFGFVALLASLLVIQAGVYVWLTVVVGRSWLGPAQLAQEVALDVGAALSANPALDVTAYVPERFGRIYQPFLVVMHDGRLASNRMDGLPPGFAGMARIAHSRRQAPEGPAPSRPEGPTRESGRGGRRLPVELWPIAAPGVEADAGYVAVPGNPPPPGVVMEQLGPTLAWVAAGLLLGGSAVMALSGPGKPPWSTGLGSQWGAAVRGPERNVVPERIEHMGVPEADGQTGDGRAVRAGTEPALREHGAWMEQ